MTRPVPQNSVTRTATPTRRTLHTLGAAGALFALTATIAAPAQASYQATAPAALTASAALASAAQNSPATNPVAQASIEPSEQQKKQIAADAKALPSGMAGAIQRDLKVSPEEYLTRTTRAQNAAAIIADIKAATNDVTGTYMTESGAIEVAVTGAKAEALARQAGLATKRVQHSEAALTAFVNSTLATLQAAGLGQSIIGIAPTQGDSLTVTVASGMQATVQAALRDSKIAITVVDGGEKLTPGSTTASTASTAPASIAAPAEDEFPWNPTIDVQGGRGIVHISVDAKIGGNLAGTNSACSMGFNAVNPEGQKSIITAGHCTDDGTQMFVHLEDVNTGVRNKVHQQPIIVDYFLGKVGTWRLGGAEGKGSETTSTAPQDFAFVDVVNPYTRFTPKVFTWPNASAANPRESVSVRAAGEAIAGADVCRSGRTSGWQCGTISTVDGMWQMSAHGTLRWVRGPQARVCGLPGDSGGSLLMGTTAIAIYAGGQNQPDNDPTTETQCKLDAEGKPVFAVFSAILPILAERPGTVLMLDIAAPEFTVTPDATSGLATVNGSAIAGDTIHVLVDGVEVTTSTVKADGTFEAALSGLPVGTRKVEVFTQRDAINKSATVAADLEIAPAPVVVPPAPVATPTPTPTPTAPAPTAPAPTAPAPVATPTPTPTAPAPAPAPAPQPWLNTSIPPVVAPAILSPTAGASITGTSVTFTGKALANTQLVYELTSGNSFTSGSMHLGAATNWATTVKLAPGTWTIRAHSVNSRGVVSKTTSRTFTVVAPVTTAAPRTTVTSTFNRLPLSSPFNNWFGNFWR